MMSDQQRAIDVFYWEHGPCCAGCDHWRSVNSAAGECTRAAPVSSADRMGLLGMSSASAEFGAGHPITMRDYRCGEFKDDFDWGALSLGYRRSIGCPT